MQKRGIALLALLLLLFATPAARADDAPAGYYVPPAQFNASLQIMDLGFSNIMVLFQGATASFMFNEADKSISRLRIAIDTTSVITSNANSQHDIVNLLGAMQYPEISITAPDSVRFEEEKTEAKGEAKSDAPPPPAGPLKAELKGTLTLHGVSKPITLQATLNRVGKSPSGGSMWSSGGTAVGLSVRGSFKRADFGIADDPASGEQPRYGDIMSLNLEMQGLRH